MSLRFSLFPTQCTMLVLALTSYSCSKNDSSTTAEGDTPEASIIQQDQDGVLIANYDSGLEADSIIPASASGPLSGSSVKILAGAISGNTELTIQEGASLINTETGLLLELNNNNSVTAHGPALYFSSSEKVTISDPIELSIPLPESLSLQDSVQFDNLIIIFKGKRQEKEGYIVGLLPREALAVGPPEAPEGFLVFKTTLFGSYQAIVTENKISDTTKISTENPIISQSEWVASRDSNSPPVVIVKQNSSSEESIEIEADLSQIFTLDVPSDNPIDELQIDITDADDNPINITVSGCPEWATCTSFDNLSREPTVTIAGIPTAEHAGSNVITLEVSDFFGEVSTWTVSINVNVPTTYPAVVSIGFIVTPTTTSNTTSCSKYVIAALDIDGKVTHPTDEATVFLSGGGDFYQDELCSSGTTTATADLSPETGTATVYFKSNTPGDKRLEVFAPSAWDWQKAEHLTNIEIGPLTSLAFTKHSDEIKPNECVTINLSSVDDALNKAPSPEDMNITISGDGSFYTDADCLTAGSTVTINATQSSISFSYKHTVAGSNQIRARSVDSDLTEATTYLSVIPAAVSKLIFSTNPIELDTTGCGFFAVTTTDAFDNKAVVTSDKAVDLRLEKISGAGGASTGAFYPDAECLEAAITSVAISSGEHTQGFYYKEPTADIVTKVHVSADSNTLSGSSADISISAPPP